MARISRKEFDRLFGALARIARGEESERDEVLAKALSSGSSHLIARAAELVHEDERERYIDTLARVIDELLDARDPVKSDPGCAAKVAVLEALDRLEHVREEPFRRGAAFVQKEGPYPPADTSTGVRVRGGLGLVRLRVQDALRVLAEMLTDEEPAVRIAGAEGVVYHGDERGVALLHMKVRAGDPDPDVLTAILAAYLRMDAETGLALTLARLSSTSQKERESAAFALGETRLPGAREALLAYLERSSTTQDTRVAAASLLMLRDPAAHAELERFAAARRDPQGALAREALERYERALHD